MISLTDFSSPAKYRRVIFSEEVDNMLKDVCLAISKRYEMVFLEIGTDKDHVQFLVQSVPSYSATKIVKTIKSITAREVAERIPSVKSQLWGGEFWSKKYFITTVGRHGNEKTIHLRYQTDVSCVIERIYIPLCRFIQA
jgi:putative transposase